MTIKLFMITSTILLFSACSEKTYEEMYKNQTNVFNCHANTAAENDNTAVLNGENPMKRPSYDEYRQRY